MARVAAIAVALSLGLSACVFGGNAVNDQKAMQVDLANQRKAAVFFMEMQGGIERIRFTQGGDIPGLGASWRANAVVMIEGEEYHAILGFNLGSVAFDGAMPIIPPDEPPTPVSVVYSDGSSEVIE
ncbi:hypothetical protein ACI2IX_06330 [Leifsonia aquatica]|uniref:hypothetical protein n=1 Tax=Leifsonia aquatica TaxID=144185 RepID=UPI00384F679F